MTVRSCSVGVVDHGFGVEAENPADGVELFDIEPGGATDVPAHLGRRKSGKFSYAGFCGVFARDFAANRLRYLCGEWAWRTLSSSGHFGIQPQLDRVWKISHLSVYIACDSRTDVFSYLYGTPATQKISHRRGDSG